MAKSLLNMVVIAPFLCLPTMYFAKGVVFDEMDRWLKNYLYDVQHKGLLQKYWIVWGPVNTLTFSIVPEDMRITFVACISFFWSIVLSSIANSEQESTGNVP